MNNPPYWPNPNDPNNLHSQPTTAGPYPQFPPAGQQPSSTQWGQQPPPYPQFPTNPGQYSQSGPNFPQYPSQFPLPGQQPLVSQKPSLWRQFRNRSKRFQFGIGCVTLFVVFFLCVGTLGAIGSSQPTTASVASQASPVIHQSVRTMPTLKPTATQAQKSAPTSIPKLVPTATPLSELTEANGPAKLGVSANNFIRIYGQPDSATSSPGVYEFSSLQVLYATDESNRVNGITSNNGGNDWNSVQSAVPDCEKFVPSDSVYQRVVELYNPANGLHTETERVYFSSQLAPLFKASDYTDEHGKLATPGTFAIVFEYDLPNNPSKIDSCDIQISLMQVQK